MFFLDTSVIISGLTPEVATSAALDWLSEHRDDEFAISDWTLTEVASALSIKVRTGQLSLDDKAASLAAFDHAVTVSYVVLPLDREHFRAAARFVGMVATGLRAGDALHIAVARDAGATLVTLDRGLAAAGISLGIKTKLIAPAV